MKMLYKIFYIKLTGGLFLLMAALSLTPACWAGESLAELPLLTVKNWYFEINGRPTYLVGYSLGNMDERQYVGQPAMGRLGNLTEGVNYMRTWLEWQHKDRYMCPFVQVDGKADLTRIDPVWLDGLKDFLDASAQAGVVQELTLFNPWYARDDWEGHYWNPANNVQGFDVTADSLYTLDNPCQSLQEQWVDKILETVDASLARHFVIIEIDNELQTGGGAWRKHFVERVKNHGNYIVSTIASYCADYDSISGTNDIICQHGGGSGYPNHYYKQTVMLKRVKPVVFNELYVWWHNDRESQRSVFWNIFLAGGMPCAYVWPEGIAHAGYTEDDLSILGKFANSIPFHRFLPDNGWLGVASGRFCAATREDGDAFLAYIWGDGPGPVRASLPEAEYEITWIDPSTGKYSSETKTIIQPGKAVLTLPDYTQDIVCYIVKK